MTDDVELKACGQALLDAAHAYFKLMRKRGLAGGCVWLTAMDGSMVVFTRGEYRDRLLYNIETNFDAKRAYSFGTAELPTDTDEPTK
jgi:hypothetical protein